MNGKPYYDLVTEAVNTKCYIWSVERYDPNGEVLSTRIMCTEEEYDELKVAADLRYLELATTNFLDDLKEKSKSE